MLLFGINFYAGFHLQLDQLAIYSRTHKTFARQLFDHVTKFAFLKPNHRREQHQPRAIRHSHEPINDLSRRLLSHRLAAFRTMRLPQVGEKQSKVIVNLRGGGDDRTHTAAGAALFNRNGWRKAFNEIQLRFLHLIEELARIGGKRLDIFTLALRINGIKCQRGFPRAAQPGDHHQLIARNAQGKVFEVMLPRPPNLDEIHLHAKPASYLAAPPLTNPMYPRANSSAWYWTG